MKLLHSYIIISFTALLLLTFSARAEKVLKDPADLFVTGSEAVQFTSEINGQDYKLLINLPGSFGQDPERKYPLLFVLDGYWKFSLATAIYYNVITDMMMPEVVIVGVSYAGHNLDYGQLRLRDFTPLEMEGYPNTGGAGEFREVIKSEMLPIIERRYATDPKKSLLIGGSSGGLFVHDVLFSDPGLFSDYLIMNPSYSWGDDPSLNAYVSDLVEQAARKNLRMNANVLLVSGGLDPDLDLHREMVEAIGKKSFEGLTLNHLILKDMGHVATEPEGITRGYIHFFHQ